MLWTIFAILLVLWVLGVGLGIGDGTLIHLLLVLALIVLVYKLLAGGRPGYSSYS